MNAIANPVTPPVWLPAKTLVIVGMPGAGKTSIGRRVAESLGLPFVDADEEIEKAADATIEEIFTRYGEAEFRQGERRVIARLLEQPPHVLSTGGGAFMDEDTRAAIREHALSIWLRVPLEILVDRTSRRTDRPLLKGSDLRTRLQNLLHVREPVFAEADIGLNSDERPAEENAVRVLQALKDHLQKQDGQKQGNI